MIKRAFFWGLLFAVVGLLISSHVFAQADKTAGAHEEQRRNAKAIKVAVELKTYATVETKARDIMGNAEKIVSLFPKGSDDRKNEGAQPQSGRNPMISPKMRKSLNKCRRRSCSRGKS